MSSTIISQRFASDDDSLCMAPFTDPIGHPLFYCPPKFAYFASNAIDLVLMSSSSNKFDFNAPLLLHLFIFVIV